MDHWSFSFPQPKSVSQKLCNVTVIVLWYKGVFKVQNHVIMIIVIVTLSGNEALNAVLNPGRQTQQIQILRATQFTIICLFKYEFV